jgi:hypothetical protein
MNKETSKELTQWVCHNKENAWNKKYSDKIKLHITNKINDAIAMGQYKTTISITPRAFGIRDTRKIILPNEYKLFLVWFRSAVVKMIGCGGYTGSMWSTEETNSYKYYVLGFLDAIHADGRYFIDTDYTSMYNYHKLIISWKD